uniref:Uncharacterized protein n=1 Tax=viral metagenome TaxID=1070528 RepID=A0A6H1ZRW4_9ZZZZ
MYGAKLSRPMGGLAQPLQHIIGTNSAVFNIGDVVDITSGYTSVLGATSDRPFGICTKKVTMASDNVTVAKVKVPVQPIGMDDQFEMDFDAAATAANQGQFFQFNTGGTGAQTIDLATASDTVGQVVLVELDPRGEGSTVRGLFRVALPEMAFEPET